MRREYRKDDAVSPVIGVMLMLVVTIVIAAVVVMFSTGLAGDTKTTPTALFEVSNFEVGIGPEEEKELAYLNLRHKGGDAIPLNDLKITLVPSGNKYTDGITTILLASDEKTHLDGGIKSYQEADPNEVATYENYLRKLTEAQANYDADPNSKNERKLEKEKRTFYERYPDGNPPAGKWINGGAEYPLSVLGQTTPTKSTISTGEILHVVSRVAEKSTTAIYEGATVKWTISYIPTNSIIAKGEFDVIAD